MRNLLTLLCMLSTNTALAQDVYGTANGCVRHGGAEVFADDIITFDGSVFEFQQSFCQVSSETPHNDGQRLFALNCFGEGQEWQLGYVIEETDVSDQLIIFPIDTPEAREEINLCR